jgi:hypothetical protein
MADGLSSGQLPTCPADELRAVKSLLWDNIIESVPAAEQEEVRDMSRSPKPQSPKILAGCPTFPTNTTLLA